MARAKEDGHALRRAVFMVEVHIVWSVGKRKLGFWGPHEVGMVVGLDERCGGRAVKKDYSKQKEDVMNFVTKLRIPCKPIPPRMDKLSGTYYLLPG